MAKKSFMQLALEGEQAEGEFRRHPENALDEAPSDDERRREERFDEMGASMDEVADVEDTVATEPEAAAGDVLPETTSVEDDYDTQQAEDFAIESIQFYQELLRDQINTGTVSMESVQIIQLAIQNVYASQGVRMRTIAVESSMSPTAYAQVVLERFALEAEHGDSSFLKRVGNVLGTLSGKAESTFKLYEQRIEDIRGEYQEKSQLMKGPIHMNMAGGVDQRWHFFSTDRGQSANLVQDIAKDTQFSKYVMFDYAPKALEALKKIIEAVSHLNPNEQEAFKNALVNLEKLPTPNSMFNQQYISGAKKPYFGVTGVDVKIGAKRKAVAFDGMVFQKLAEMASPQYVYETSSFKHGVKKFFGVSGGNKKVAINIQDVDALLKGAEEYNNAIGQSVKILHESEGLIREALQTVSRIQNDGAVKGQLRGAIDAGAMAVFTIVRDEQKRAMAGAMHCLWAAMYSIEGLTKQGSKGVTNV